MTSASQEPRITPEDKPAKPSIDVYLKKKEVKDLLDKCREYCSQFGSNLKEKDIVEVFDVSCWKIATVKKVTSNTFEGYVDLEINGWGSNTVKLTKTSSPEIKPLWINSRLETCYEVDYFCSYTASMSNLDRV